MQLDLRWPIGLMFTINGILLVGYGLFNRAGSLTRIDGSDLNINLQWGAVLLTFGLIMSVAALLGRNKSD